MKIRIIQRFFVRIAFIIWYKYVSRVDQKNEVLFLNYGYDSEDLHLELDGNDKTNEYQINLYYQLVSQIELKNKVILEIGCGRGGGLNFISNHFNVAAASGIDLTSDAISFCQKHYSLENVKYCMGDAHQLPFDNESFDVVINVESSHRYKKIVKFISEVKRVLKPEGFFLLTDFRTPEAYVMLKKLLDEGGFDLILEKDITPNVLSALMKDDGRKRDLVNKLIPPYLKSITLSFVGAIGSKTFLKFSEGEFVYYNFILRKR